MPANDKLTINIFSKQRNKDGTLITDIRKENGITITRGEDGGKFKYTLVIDI